MVGERTFGEGSVQKTIELPDGAALLLTVAKYQSPSGKKIQDDAVTPTVAVGPPIEEEDEEAAAARQGRRAAEQGAGTAEGEERLSLTGLFPCSCTCCTVAVTPSNTRTEAMLALG